MANITVNSIITVLSLTCWIWVVYIVKKILDTKRQELSIMMSLKSDISHLKTEINRLKNNQ